MKIGIIHTVYQQPSGEDNVVKAEFECLGKRGYQVTQLLFNNSNNGLVKLWNYINSPFNLLAYRNVSQWLTMEKPDVVHVHNWHFAASPSVIRAIKKKGVPIIVTLHNFRLLCPSAFLFHNGKLFLSSLSQAFPWRAVINRVYRQSFTQTFWLAFTVWLHKQIGTWQSVDRYITLSSNAQKIFLSSSLGLRNDQIVVKPNFSEVVMQSNRKRGNHFLYIGRLSEEKGIHILVEAFRKSKLELIIIGDGPLRNIVEAATNEAANIRYLGFQKKERILNEIQQCTALVFPSLWYEGFPLVIAEAFSCSTPVIGSRLGAMEVIIKDKYNGLLFAHGDTEDLVDKTTTWHKMQKENQKQIQTNAGTTFEEYYTVDKNMQQLIEIYQSMLKKA